MKSQITLAAELETLGKFRGFIDEFCLLSGIADDTCHDLKLAVDEASTNVVTHGYAGMNPGSIMLALEIEAELVRVELTDFGHSFEPAEPEAPDPEAALRDPASGGLGLYFIYQTMDEIRYRSGEEGNVLTFIKILEN
jgi:anti-sigma regulatory factor (Ser/Thr protein kinase)